MPSVSAKQERAMHAAANGKSTLGIPKSVGEEFVGKDGVPQAAGIVFVAPNGDVLLLRRSSEEENYAGHWALPGGKADDGETPEQAAIREAREEMGLDTEALETTLRAIDRVETPNGMIFTTFASLAPEKFFPSLNGEHEGFAWVPLSAMPQPLHPSVARTLGEHIGVTEDMEPEDWKGLVDGFLKFISEEMREEEHAESAMDEAPKVGFIPRREPVLGLPSSDRQRRIALDRKSVRTYDRDGRLHVERTHISKANVCEYFGREVPNGDELKLDPDRKYSFYRDPEELAKGAPTFRNIPLLDRHVPVTADAPRPELVVGALGSNPVFEAPYLDNEIIIWDGSAIREIEADQKKELSAAYYWRADMTPGTSPDGEKYDGVMRDIVANHVALVREGRAGPDVVVGDSKEELNDMAKKVALTRTAAAAKGAVIAYLRPKLAQDAKIDVHPLFVGVTKDNLAAKRGDIATGLKALTKDKLAQDADIEDVVELLDMLQPEIEAQDMDPNAGVPPVKVPAVKVGADNDLMAKLKEFLAGKLSDEDMAALEALASDEDDDGKKKAEDEEEVVEKKDVVTKAAMDAAISNAVKTAVQTTRATEQAIRDAEREVRPYVGELAMAHDSAEGVYRTALAMQKVEIEGVDDMPLGALKAILKTQPVPGQRRRDALPAMDAKSGKDFAERHPGASRISVL